MNELAGYRRISGYQKYSGPPLKEGKPVPGVGPVLSLTFEDGAYFAIRSDGVEPVKWMATGEAWVRVGPATDTGAR